MKPLTLGLVGCVLATACMTSARASKSPRVRTADGIAATLSLLSGETVAGELLALDTVSATVLTPNRLLVVPHALVARATFPGYRPVLRGRSGFTVTGEEWSRIRLESRYPYGIPAPALDVLLRSRNQARPDTLAGR